MLQVDGQDPGVLNRRMRHHAERFRPLIDALVYSLLESKVASDDQVHRLYQSRNGPGSFGLYLADGREFHFRPGPGGDADPPKVNVLSAYRNGQVVKTLASPAQARHFVRTLMKGR